GAGHPLYHRSVAALAVGQHLIVGGEVDPAVLNAVEHVAAGAVVSGGKLGTQRIDIVLDPRSDIVPGVTVVGSTPGRIVAYPPAAKIQPAAQVKILAAVVAMVAVLILRAGQSIVGEQHRHTVLPAGGVNVAGAALAQRGLGYAQA